jgi:hypothetical protein
MDMSIDNMAARATSLNKATVGQDILLKTLEKSAEAQVKNEATTARPVERLEADKQGRIDIYA